MRDPRLVGSQIADNPRGYCTAAVLVSQNAAMHDPRLVGRRRRSRAAYARLPASL